MKHLLIIPALILCTLFTGCVAQRPGPSTPSTQPAPEQASTLRAGWELIDTGVEVARFAGEIDEDAYALFKAINPFVRRIIYAAESGRPIDTITLAIEIRAALQQVNEHKTLERPPR